MISKSVILLLLTGCPLLTFSQNVDCVTKTQSGYLIHLYWQDKRIVDTGHIFFSVSSFDSLLFSKHSLDEFLGDFFKQANYTDLLHTEPMLKSKCSGAERVDKFVTKKRRNSHHLNFVLSDGTLIGATFEKWSFEFLTFRVYKEYIQNESVGIRPVGVTEEFRNGRKVVAINRWYHLSNQEKRKIRSVFSKVLEK